MSCLKQVSRIEFHALRLQILDSQYETDLLLGLQVQNFPSFEDITDRRDSSVAECRGSFPHCSIQRTWSILLCLTTSSHRRDVVQCMQVFKHLVRIMTTGNIICTTASQGESIIVLGGFVKPEYRVSDECLSFSIELRSRFKTFQLGQDSCPCFTTS